MSFKNQHPVNQGPNDQLLKSLSKGSTICSKHSSYMVQDCVGEGTFGKVMKCIDISNYKVVAIKIIKDHASNSQETQDEMAMLTQLKGINRDGNFVDYQGSFIYKSHICLKFEALDISLQQLLHQRKHMSLKDVRPILHQLVTGLKNLKLLGIAHADLKPANIMLVDQQKRPLEVKMIDFGLAHQVNREELHTYIQTRWYRAPEILLGLPYTQAIDMWSLGCIAAEMCTGQPLYPGNSSYDMIRYIVDTHGQPPDHLLDAGVNTNCFFKKKGFQKSQWRLRTSDKYGATVWPVRKDEKAVRSLDDIMRCIPYDNHEKYYAAQAVDRHVFLDLLKKMLQLDGHRRITPEQALQHPFLTMSHQAYSNSTYVKSCFKTMDICRTKRATTAVAPTLHHHPSHSLQASSTVSSLAQLTQQQVDQHTSPQRPRSVSSGTHQTLRTRRNEPYLVHKRAAYHRQTVGRFDRMPTPYYPTPAPQSVVASVSSRDTTHASLVSPISPDYKAEALRTNPDKATPTTQAGPSKVASAASAPETLPAQPATPGQGQSGGQLFGPHEDKHSVQSRKKVNSIDKGLVVRDHEQSNEVVGKQKRKRDKSGSRTSINTPGTKLKRKRHKSKLCEAEHSAHPTTSTKPIKPSDHRTVKSGKRKDRKKKCKGLNLRQKVMGLMKNDPHAIVRKAVCQRRSVGKYDRPS